MLEIQPNPVYHLSIHGVKSRIVFDTSWMLFALRKRQGQAPQYYLLLPWHKLHLLTLDYSKALWGVIISVYMLYMNTDRLLSSIHKQKFHTYRS